MATPNPLSQSAPISSSSSSPSANHSPLAKKLSKSRLTGSSSSSSKIKVKKPKERIANTLEGYGRNVARFRISGSSDRVQIGAYFWCPDLGKVGQAEDKIFSVAAFVGSALPDSEDLKSWASFITINFDELTKGVWLNWSVDRTDDVCLIFDAALEDGDSRYFFNGLVLDEAPADDAAPSKPEEKAVFLGKHSEPPKGACGGVYVGTWDKDYIVPNSPSSPDGAPRLVGYHLNAGKSIRVRRRHYSGFAHDPRGLAKMPAWLDSDPTAIQLDSQEVSRVRQVFDKFDHDHNSYIDRKELKAVVEHVYELFRDQQVTQEQIDHIFNKYDKNKDSRLSFDEFKYIFLHIKKDMVKENMLHHYPKHFQYRANSHIPWVSSIKVAGLSPEQEAQYYPVQSSQYSTNTDAYQLFSPVWYNTMPIDYYGYDSDSSSSSDDSTSTYSDSSSDDDDFLYFQPPPPPQMFNHPPPQIPHQPPPQLVDPRLAQFSVPPQASAPHGLLFPELPALRDLAYLKQEIPMNDYFHVQAGFLRFLKLRLGLAEFLNPPAPTPPPQTFEHLYNAHHHHFVPPPPPPPSFFPPPFFDFPVPHAADFHLPYPVPHHAHHYHGGHGHYHPYPHAHADQSSFYGYDPQAYAAAYYAQQGAYDPSSAAYPSTYSSQEQADKPETPSSEVVVEELPTNEPIVEEPVKEDEEPAQAASSEPSN